MSRKGVGVTRTVLVSLAILGVGAGSFMVLSNMRKPPAQASIGETPLLVEAVRVAREDVGVVVKGYGEARALNSVTIAPEVAGKVLYVHERLEVGEVIPGGEVLFEIDGRDYEAGRAQANADIARAEYAVERLKTQFEIDRDRLGTLSRNRDLSKTQFDRVRALLEEDVITTESEVDQAERVYQLAVDQVQQLVQSVELYPFQIREAKAVLLAAEAKGALAEANLERTIVRAPFDGRLKMVRLERDQYVTPGMNVLTLADDSVLELSVSLDSRQARRWLNFKENSSSGGRAWFSELVHATCRIMWTEGDKGQSWAGVVHRVEKFDEETRTLTVAIRVEAKQALSSGPEHLPLVEGMYCRVEIPGRTARDVIRLPGEAVSFDNTVYVAQGDRLETREITLSHRDGESAFIKGGLDPDELVITTPLVNPLEGTLLSVRNAGE